MNTPGTPGRQWAQNSTARTRDRLNRYLGRSGAEPANTTTTEQNAPSMNEPDDLNEEYRLFYPCPAATRGAGNNPGLGSANRGFSFQQNDNPNTPFKGISPISLSRGPQTPDRSLYPASPGPSHGLHPATADDFACTRPLASGAGALGGRCASESACGDGAQSEGSYWVTLFGFPQGYQDGMLKILRDRGEIVEHSYSGTNHLSVRFTNAEAVADAVGLNGSILPAEGLPGENYMIGVKRGTAQLERGDAGASQPDGAMLKMRPKTALPPQGSSSASGLKGSFGRFMSELWDITDLSGRD